MNTLECNKIHVIACDLDDSLVATQSRPEQVRQESDTALLELGAFVTALRLHDEHAQNEQPNPVVYFGSSTGRTLASIQELAEQRPAFGMIFGMMDFHSTSVGSALYARQAGATTPARVASWPESASWNRDALADRLAGHPDLTPQELAAQDTHKISYTTDSRLDNTVHAAQLRSYIGEANLQADVIASGSGSWRFVDILPVGINKGTALLHLPGLLGSNALEHTICRVAIGDSMNDQAALAAANVAIIPGNAQPDLMRWATENQQSGALHITDKHFAAGALQGLQQHIGPRWQL